MMGFASYSTHPTGFDDKLPLWSSSTTNYRRYQGEEMNEVPQHQIRAVYNERTIRIYQAFSDEIADSALAHGRFICPPFKMGRMTWIKPSFLWMMYRSNWGYKDSGQHRILAIDLSRHGFDWALQHGCPSHPPPSIRREDWSRLKMSSPVRIQWDPERNLRLEPLPYRAIQVGLKDIAVDMYINSWIQGITDITSLAHEIHDLVSDNATEHARQKLPIEKPYPTHPNSSDP
jgi:hypothetical protein